jgi:hypothetical protein
VPVMLNGAILVNHLLASPESDWCAPHDHVEPAHSKL